MKKYIFKNPVKEALKIQGVRWVVVAFGASALLLALGLLAINIGMPIWGSIAAVVAVAVLGFFFCWFGFETVPAEE